MAFLARHNRNHTILPSELNFRANIHGLKQLGVEWILSASAVGSLKKDFHPLDIVLPDQFYDRTKARISTFFGNGIVAHISFGDPVCHVLADVIEVVGLDVGDDDMVEQLEQRRNVRAGAGADLERHAAPVPGGGMAERALAVTEAGTDVILHCNGRLPEMTLVADAAPDLAGKPLARFDAAMARIGPSNAPDEAEAESRLAELVATV